MAEDVAVAKGPRCLRTAIGERGCAQGGAGGLRSGSAQSAVAAAALPAHSMGCGRRQTFFGFQTLSFRIVQTMQSDVDGGGAFVRGWAGKCGVWNAECGIGKIGLRETGSAMGGLE